MNEKWLEIVSQLKKDIVLDDDMSNSMQRCLLSKVLEMEQALEMTPSEFKDRYYYY